LTWGRFSKETIKLRPNIIIAADIFFDENDFEDILCTIQYYFQHGCQSFYTVLQRRGTARTLGGMLLKWKMKCEQLDIEHLIMNSDYLAIDDCDKLMLVKITSVQTSNDNKFHRNESVMTLLQ